MNYTKYEGMALPTSKLGHTHRSTVIGIPEDASAVSVDVLDAAIMDLPMIIERCQSLEICLEHIEEDIRGYINNEWAGTTEAWKEILLSIGAILD